MAQTVKQQNVTRQIKGEIYNSLRNSLVAPSGKSKQSWTDAFIKEMLKEAKANPNGPLGQLLARQLLQDDIISSLDEQTEKLLMRDQDFLHYRLLKQLYDKQRDVLLDKWISRKIIMCSRRAGKTECAARILVDYCIEPNIPVLYINTKFENAIKQCFPLCKKAAQEAELVIAHASENEGLITFANGSSITFKGNNNKAAAPLLRGGKYKCIIIDEIQSQCNLNELIYDVCEPMLVDFENSCLIVQGTPPRYKGAWCEKIWDEGKWKHYHFTMEDNPFIKNAKEYIDKLCEEKGIERDDPLIQREYYGIMGAYDTEAMIFKHYATYDSIPDDFIPEGAYIGVDFGFEDNNAIVPVVFNKDIAYVLDTINFNHSGTMDIENSVIDEYNRLTEWLKQKGVYDNTRMTIIGDSSNKDILYDLYLKGYPSACCYKYDKQNAISLMADYLRTAKLNIHKGDFLETEFQQLMYKRDDQDNIINEIDEDFFHGNAYMALLYVMRQIWYDVGIDLGGESKNKQEGWIN